ncbi:hypothetical protein Y1Q_0017361 [Alligator mississippiensis]|uniref:Uncharacterized protein n=1 Tax=Alligator mississippiensis TaxID=8496 RepID=A0A151NGD2_ALLMI|nr:hypothetical protein Y1Q_0017361 [Alligator mississippiensis]
MIITMMLQTRENLAWDPELQQCISEEFTRLFDRKTQRSQNNESKEMTKEEMTYMDMRFCSSSQERRSQRSQNSEKDERPQNNESKGSVMCVTKRLP